MSLNQTEAVQNAAEAERGDLRALSAVLRDTAKKLGGIASTATIAIAASSTTDGMDITVTVKDADGVTVPDVFVLDLYMSEAATGIGITGDTYSGDLTAGTGSVLGAVTAKKHWKITTAATGVFVGTLVASANPTDQYAVVKKPLGAGVVVSDASGTNWQGA